MAVGCHAGISCATTREAVFPSSPSVLPNPALKNLNAVESLLRAHVEVHLQPLFKKHCNANQKAAHEISYQRPLSKVAEDVKCLAAVVFVFRS